MAVTVLGILLANSKGISIQHVVAFKEHLQVLLISCLFILLGARISISDLMELGWAGLAFLAGVVLVVRPATVLVASWGSDLNWRERTLVGTCAPRGIVAAAISSVFALKMAALSEQPDAVTRQGEMLVSATFLIILGTVLFYGIVTPWIARRLGLSDSDRREYSSPEQTGRPERSPRLCRRTEYPVRLVDTNYQHCAAARMLGVPATCASILSEHVLEDLDLGGMGRFFAMTSNDELNAMASTSPGPSLRTS